MKRLAEPRRFYPCFHQAPKALALMLVNVTTTRWSALKHWEILLNKLLFDWLCRAKVLSRRSSVEEEKQRLWPAANRMPKQRFQHFRGPQGGPLFSGPSRCSLMKACSFALIRAGVVIHSSPCVSFQRVTTACTPLWELIRHQRRRKGDDDSMCKMNMAGYKITPQKASGRNTTIALTHLGSPERD